MTSKGLSFVGKNCSSAKSYLLGSTRISQSSCQVDFNSIVVGLSLYFGVLLDYNVQFCNAEEMSRNRGRIISSSVCFVGAEVPLTDLLTYLDEIGDVLLKHISSDTEFKAQSFLTEARTVTVGGFFCAHRNALIGLLCSLSEHCKERVQLIRAVRQITCFLKKLDVRRPDLDEATKRGFLLFEESLQSDVPLRMSSIDYLTDVFDMKRILDSHLEHFSMAPFVPRHGPGASADTSVRCWLDKHRSAKHDDRLGYLLRHTSLGSQKDYLPLIKDAKSDRTSRYICVPKTWKKLRGISAEPVELMYAQQAVLWSLDRMFTTDKWWARRINLHSQQKSQDMARKGSIDGSFATIDLSAASDSVTLQLVHDLFGHSELARWLIGTRSVASICDNSTVKLSKFAPMGSACCFPVECMVFALAAEVAVRRTCKTSRSKIRQSRIFGDDIIIPGDAADELLNILDHLGFSVNTEKSYWRGRFREACGGEFWNGLSISPCRFRRLHSGLKGRYTDYAEVAACTSLANFLFDRGLHETRAFLLDVLYTKRVRLSKTNTVSCQKAIFASFSGERNSLSSPCPTNFQLDWKVSRPLQTIVCRRLTWAERLSSRNVPEKDLQDLSICEYTEWLIRHQDGVADFDELWSDGFIADTATQPLSRLPIGTVMVPTYRWCLAPNVENLKTL